MKNLAIAIFLVLLPLVPSLAIAHFAHNEKEKGALSGKETTSNSALKVLRPSASPKRYQLEVQKHNQGTDSRDSGYEKFIKWIGNFHLIALHFPIALLTMGGFSEFLVRKFPSALFEHSSRFLIVAAAITATPTALLGLAYSYDTTYTGILSDIFWWHAFFGICTALFAFTSALLKELYLRKKIRNLNYYYIFLSAAIFAVSAAGYLGGEMTFGLNHLFP